MRSTQEDGYFITKDSNSNRTLFGTGISGAIHTINVIIGILKFCLSKKLPNFINVQELQINVNAYL